MDFGATAILSFSNMADTRGNFKCNLLLFWIFVNMEDTVVILKFVIIILNNCYSKQRRHFELSAICRTCVLFKHNLNIYYLNKTAMLQYGDLRDNFKPNFELVVWIEQPFLQYGGHACYLNLT